MRLQARVVSAAAIVTAMAAFAPTASAATLDQSTSGTNGALSDCFYAAGFQSLEQTFTAGRTGSLARVDLALAGYFAPVPTAPLTVEVRDVDAGKPGPNVLGTRTFAPADLPVFVEGPALAFFAIPLAAPIPVTNGTEYAVVAYSSGQSRYVWCLAADPYAGGESGFQAPAPPLAGGWLINSQFAARDLTFKTYVEGPDTTKPSAPTFAGAYLRVVQSSGPAVLTGTARDNAGVASVKVRIRASTSGASFDRTYTATLSSSGIDATNVTWSLNLKTLMPALPPGTYTSTIQTTDFLGGNVSTATPGPAIVRVS